jgi:hypothetical protein
MRKELSQYSCPESDKVVPAQATEFLPQAVRIGPSQRDYLRD